MKISEIIKRLSEIQKRFGDLDVEAATADFDAVEKALNRKDPFPVELKIKPTGAKRPDEL